ncbi:MAG: TRAP transporter substrate-binding protein [Rhodothalassiaceae bacterium]
MTKEPKTDPDRRKALKAAALVGASAVGAASIAGILANRGQRTQQAGQAPAITGRAARRLKMVTTWPKNFPGVGTGADRLARRIMEASGGRIEITVYAAGELVPALGAFDAVSQGKADLYHGAEYYWQGRSHAFNFFAAVPMGLVANEMFAWIRFGGGQELWDQLSARFNVKAMPAGSTGTQLGGWFRRPVETPDDFRGLRIRMPGLGGEVMQRLGATPVTKAGGELFQALDQGNVDATEWVGPWNDMAFAFHTIVKNYYYPGIHEPGTVLALGINRDLWLDLTATERALIESAAAAESNVMLAEYEHNNALALERLLKETDVTLRRFSDAILKRMAEASVAVLEDVAAADPFTREVYDSFRAARRRGTRWGDISERAFAHARSFIGD